MCDDGERAGARDVCVGVPRARDMFPVVEAPPVKRKGRKTPAGRGAVIRRLRRQYDLSADEAQRAANAANWAWWGVDCADGAALYVKTSRFPRCAAGRMVSNRGGYPMPENAPQCYTEGRPYPSGMFGRRRGGMSYMTLRTIALGLSGI